MAITVEARGREFSFPDGTTNEQIGVAIDEFFQQGAAAQRQEVASPQGVAVQEEAVAVAPSGADLAGLSEAQRQLLNTPLDQLSGQQRRNKINLQRRVDSAIAREQRLSQLNPDLRRQIEETGAGEAALIASGRFFEQIGRGGQQLLADLAAGGAVNDLTLVEVQLQDAIRREDQEDIASLTDVRNRLLQGLQEQRQLSGDIAAAERQSISEIQPLREEFPGATAAGEFGTALLTAIPGGAVGGVRAAPLIGAAESQLIPTTGETEAERGSQRLLQAALGAGAPAALQAISSPLRRAATGQIPEEAAEVIAAGQRTGIPVQTSDVIDQTISGKLFTQAGRRIPIIGTGGATKAQQEAREKAVRDIFNELPPPDDQAIIRSLTSKVDQRKVAAGNRLNNIIEQVDEVGDIPLSNTVRAIDRAIKRLEEVKIKPDTSTIAELKAIREGAEQAHTFSQLRDSRTAVREFAQSVDAMGRSQLPSKSLSAVESIRAAMTKDLDEAVESSLGPQGLARYKGADRVYAEEAKKLTKSRLKNILDSGDIEPEKAASLVFSQSPSQQKLLFKNLTPEGKAAARASVLREAMRGAVDDVTGNVNPNKFVSNLGKKNIKSAVDIFFSKADRQQLKGLRRLLAKTSGAQADAATQSGQQLLLPILGGAAATSPTAAVGIGTTGLAARVYESPAVRDLLLRLANAPKDSPLENQIFNSLAGAINNAVEQARREE